MEIELGQLFRSMRRWWWAPVVFGLLCGLVGFGSVRLFPKSYEANSQMLVMSQVSGNNLVAGSSRAGTYVSLAKSGPILDRVILELGLGEEYAREDLSKLIEVRSIGAQIIEVSVTTDDPELSAAISNSLTHHLTSLAQDLSIGELERNLADVQAQIDVQRARILTIEARLAEIDTPQNADDSEIQAEVDALERERIQISQLIVDLEQTARAFNTELITLTAPIVVTDDAQVPTDELNPVSPVLLALLGSILGGLIGVTWITFWAFSDRTLRTVDQVALLPLLSTLSLNEVNDGESPAVAVLGAKISGMSQSVDNSIIALVSARDEKAVTSLRDALMPVDASSLAGIQSAGAVLENAQSMRTAAAATEAVIVATLNRTSLADLEEVANILAATRTRVIGTVVVE